MATENFLSERLQKREAEGALRALSVYEGWTDFCSNDYLGMARNPLLREETERLIEQESLPYGSGGSRLLAGNNALTESLERQIADFHEAPAALIFNSGYDANTGLFASVPRRGDVILYDRLIHASIHDGMRLSSATAFSFAHNDLEELENKLKKIKERVFVAVESIYSMDGDQADLQSIADLCDRYNAYLIVDEAHSTGLTGTRGEGHVQQSRLQNKCFARIHTFGKALGVHGAVILGSESLKQYLINFARSFIYTTALPPASIAAIQCSYDFFPSMTEERAQLHTLIQHFQQAILPFEKLKSKTAIQGVIVPGNAEVKRVAGLLHEKKIDVRPILSPTVEKGVERLRIVLHSFNTIAELDDLILVLRKAIY